MATPATVIAETMVDLMIADSDFDAVEKFIVGPWFRAQHLATIATVHITAAIEDAQLTGNRRRIGYTGLIQFESKIQDVITVTNRKHVMTSTQTVNDLVDNAIAFFKECANQNLGNPTIDRGAVDLIEIADEPVEYPALERDNTWFAVASVPFVVFTWETMPA
jgi:hypothetical protein